MSAPARLRHIGDSGGFAQALLSLAVAALVTLGAAGTLVHLFARGGWVATLFERSVAGGLAALFALAMVGTSLWLAHGWVPVRARERCSEAVVYLFAVLGLVYAAQAFMKGSL